MTRLILLITVCAALASAGCSGEPRRVRIVAVYQEGDLGFGGGEPRWYTTVEVIDTGRRYYRRGKFGAVGDEFTE